MADSRLDIDVTVLEIQQYLNAGKKVYIESGAAVDRVLSIETLEHKTHAWQEHTDKEYMLHTTACIFPESMQLENYEHVDTEEFGGNLFVHVY